MNTVMVIVAGIAFIIVGLAFFFISIRIKSTKAASMLFNAIGTVTAVLGVMALVFHSDLTKLAVEIAGVLYLVFLIVVLGIFTAMIKGNNDNERNDSQR